MTTPRRILHVLDCMERGGIAAWLMTVLRHIDRSGFRMDFLVHTAEPCAYDDEARALGARIIPCPHHKRPLTYSVQFSRILRKNGPYDVVHGHCHRFSGLNLMLAAWAGVPVRIAHSHNDVRCLLPDKGLVARRYYAAMDRLIARYGTVGLSASCLAAEDLFGRGWDREKRCRLLFCGIDLTPFHRAPERSNVRSELGLPDSAKVIAHVGRFIYQKNHPFMVDFAAEVLGRDENVRMLFIGDGPLQDETERLVTDAGLDDKVLFLGSRADVPRLLLGCVDLFVFPSLHEGLGLAIVEAQAAGIPCLISPFIPEEADVVPQLVQRISLSEPAHVWADEAVKALQQERPISQQDALAMVESSAFDIRNSIEELESVYSQSPVRERRRSPDSVSNDAAHAPDGGR